MKLVFLDSRENEIDEVPRKGSLPKPSGWKLNEYIVDLANLPDVGEFAPAVVCAISSDRPMRISLAALEVPQKLSCRELPSAAAAWGAAALTLAIKKFGCTHSDRADAEAQIAYWVKRGPERKGLIEDDRDALPLLILHLWNLWQTPEFDSAAKSKKLTIWGARLETVKEAGYKIPLTEARLKRTCQRMFSSRKNG